MLGGRVLEVSGKVLQAIASSPRGVAVSAQIDGGGEIVPLGEGFA
tara:strand:+ start:235 stop:369 length:135 start_codon:yes stop_codon:yes gene_type:complete